MKQVINTIKDQCMRNYESIAVMEHITSGCLQMLLGSVSQAGQYFSGGITVPTDDQLRMQLAVAPLHPDNKSETNLALTIEMARKVARQFNSEIGIAVSGCAQHTGNPFEPSYAAIVRLGKVIYAEKLIPRSGSPDAISIEYAQRVVNVLAEKLLPEPEEYSPATTRILEPLS